MQDFDFQMHCLFCGETCNLEKDPKNPGRWRKAYLCRTVGDTSAGESDMKQEILNVCQTRHDEWSAEVRVRVLGAVSDLHAADTRYHAECKLNFMSPKHVRLAAAGSTLSSEQAKVDSAFEHVADVMLKDESHIWNSIELFQM